ncbi:hypothetical protein JZU68_02255, partial [bacterium]|nr:hypothetical protein [bacterium]
MNYQLLSNLFFGSAMISVFLSFLALTNRKNSANKTLSLLLIATALWSLFYGLELISSSYPQLHLYLVLEYFGIATIPVFWVLFASIYCGRDGWLTNVNIALLFLIPLITIISVASNNYHLMFYESSVLFDAGNYFYHDFISGKLYWLHIIYSYTLIFIGIIMVSKTYIRVSKDQRTRVLIIIIGAAIPAIMSVMYVVGIRPEGNVDLTPIGFLAMGILVSVGTFNKGLLDIKPLILSSLYESIPNALVVVDLNGEITSTNPKAVNMLLKGD